MNENICTKRYVFLTQNGRGGGNRCPHRYHHQSLTNSPSSRAGGRGTCSGDLPPGTISAFSRIRSSLCVAVVLLDVFGEGMERQFCERRLNVRSTRAHVCHYNGTISKYRFGVLFMMIITSGVFSIFFVRGSKY